MPTPSPRGSLLNAPEYADRVNLIKKIKVGATWRFARPLFLSSHEGAYYIEWRERGKRCR